MSSTATKLLVQATLYDDLNRFTRTCNARCLASALPQDASVCMSSRQFKSNKNELGHLEPYLLTLYPDEVKYI
jgi:hypothetical protein